MSIDVAEVWWDEPGREPVNVGVLRPSFQGGRTLASASFEYTPGYLARPDAFAVSPDLPLVLGRQFTRENQTMFGAFDDASPDDWGQKIVEANHARLRRADPTLPPRIGHFDYLIGVSDHTRVGALRLRDPATHEWLSSDAGVANTYELERVVAAARRYEANEATDEDMDYLGDVATSPGGARPKANVVTAAGRLAIAKLPHSKDGAIDVERWEALALELAERCGIRTPPRRLYPTGDDKSVLVLERFDRTPDGERLAYLSAATTLGLGANDDRSVTYEEFTDTIADLCADPGPELREMFTRIALTVLIHNVDDHWRNHGFLRVGGAWRLSPVFDVNPSRVASVRSRRINANDDPRNRDIRHLLESAPAFHLTDREAGEIIRRVADEVDRWPQIADGMAIPASQHELLRSAFDATRRDDARALVAPLVSVTRPRPTSRKGAALARLAELLGEPYELGRGSSIPSRMFTDAARRVGVSTAGTMPERAQRVVEAAGLNWDPTFDSRDTPSGGGSTVTLGGLERLIEALEARDGARSPAD